MKPPYSAQTEKHLATAFLLIVFAQNPPWPIWEFQHVLVVLSVTIGLILSIPSGVGFFRGGHLGFLAIICSFIYFFVAHGIFGSIRFSSVFFALTLFLIFRSDSKIGARAFDQISYIFSTILLVSLIFWIIWQLDFPLPSSPMSYGAWKGVDVGVDLENFYLFVSESQASVKRFYSVFDEPGVVGTLAAFVLCGLRFDFRLKRTWIILTGGLFSLSLAFVVLFVVGYIFFNESRRQKYIILGIFALVCAIGAFLIESILPENYSGVILLLYRIANFSEHGVESRTGEKLNEFFIEYASSLRLIFGEGTAFFDLNPDLLWGQGSKIYIVEYGALGVALLLLVYISLIQSNTKTKNRGFYLLIVFFLSFLQRPHLMTPWQIVLFWTILCAWTEGQKMQEKLYLKD